MRTILQRPNLLLLVIALVFIYSVHVPAEAQNAQAPKMVAANKESAIYLGAQGNLVQVKLGENSWLMQLDPKVAITYTGTAETDFIQLAQAPLMVRFKAEIHNRQKKATEPVTEFEIINATDKNIAGAVLDGLGAGAGIAPEQPKGPLPETQHYLITGPVSSYKNGELTVLGIKVPVDPMAKVTVTLTGPAALLATPLQSNTIINYKHYPMQPGRGILLKMDTIGTEPLAAPKKPTPRTPPATNTKGKVPEPKPEEPKPEEKAE